jgi:hypothetical protein
MRVGIDASSLVNEAILRLFGINLVDIIVGKDMVIAARQKDFFNYRGAV